MLERNILVPEQLPLPDKLRYFFWSIVSFFLALIIYYALLMFFPSFWLNKTILILGAFFSLMCEIFSMPVYLYDKKEISQ